jgi:hypothetical protein
LADEEGGGVIYSLLGTNSNAAANRVVSGGWGIGGISTSGVYRERWGVDTWAPGWGSAGDLTVFYNGFSSRGGSGCPDPCGFFTSMPNSPTFVPPPRGYTGESDVCGFGVANCTRAK